MKQEYKPTEEFISAMKNKSWSDWKCDYEDYGDKKKLRNDYDNRMSKRNLLIYYMDHLNTKLYFDKQYLVEQLARKGKPKKDNIQMWIQELNDGCVLGCVS